MKHEDKKLLLQYLCMALPYDVKVAIEYSKGKYTPIYDLREIDNDATSELRQQVTVWNYGFYSSVISYPLINCRPYLRPMSSMTEEERIEFTKLFYKWHDDELFDYIEEGVEFSIWKHKGISPVVFDWLNTYHFDYRGLIEKGLAIEVTKENNPYKN